MRGGRESRGGGMLGDVGVFDTGWRPVESPIYTSARARQRRTGGTRPPPFIVLCCALGTYRSLACRAVGCLQSTVGKLPTRRAELSFRSVGKR